MKFIFISSSSVILTSFYIIPELSLDLSVSSGSSSSSSLSKSAKLSLLYFKSILLSKNSVFKSKYYFLSSGKYSIFSLTSLTFYILIYIIIKFMN